MLEDWKDILEVAIPVLSWVFWSTRMHFKNQSSLDIAHFKLRNEKGMRDRSLKGQWKRIKHNRKKGDSNE